MTGIVLRAVAAAAIAVVPAALAWPQSAPAPAFGCEEVRALMETEQKVRRSLGWIEQMGQMLLDQAKSKNEEIEACAGQAGDPDCASGLQARREDEVKRLMEQVRDLKAARASIEESLKEAMDHLKELTEKLPDKEGCPHAKG